MENSEKEYKKISEEFRNAGLEDLMNLGGINSDDIEAISSASKKMSPEDVSGLTRTLLEMVDLSVRRSRLSDERLNNKIEKISDINSTDELTGLTNRRGFNENFSIVMEAIRRKNDKDIGAVLLFIDLDEFKAINDTFSHGFGDAALVKVADELRKAVRIGDTVARIGGDEFVLILLHDDDSTNLSLAEFEEKKAELVRQIFGKKYRLNPKGVNDRKEVTINASVGVIAINHTKAVEQTNEALLNKADKMMYDIKEAGRRAKNDERTRKAAMRKMLDGYVPS